MLIRLASVLSLLIFFLLFAAPVFAQPFAYVANFFSNNVSVIDTATNTTVGLPIPVELSPRGVAITPPPPPPPIADVPTLSEWGLIAMASILGIVGFMVMRRRKATA